MNRISRRPTSLNKHPMSRFELVDPRDALGKLAKERDAGRRARFREPLAGQKRKRQKNCTIQRQFAQISGKSVLMIARTFVIGGNSIELAVEMRQTMSSVRLPP